MATCGNPCLDLLPMLYLRRGACAAKKLRKAYQKKVVKP